MPANHKKKSLKTSVIVTFTVSLMPSIKLIYY